MHTDDGFKFGREPGDVNPTREQDLLISRYKRANALFLSPRGGL